MMNFYKKDTLNDKFEEFEKRFQLKLDEQNITHNQQIQKLNDKIARLETENSRTYELIDKLYEYRFKEISCQVSDCNIKIENILKNLQNKSNNNFDQQGTNENVILLISKINDNVSSIENDVSAITENITALEDRQCLVDMYDLKIMVDRIVKLEENKLSDCNDLKKITKQINILTTKQSLTDDILLNIKNDIILINTDSHIGNKSQQNVISELSVKIKILTDNVSNIQNINNKFDREIHKLTTQQHLTTENLNALQHTNTWSCIDTTIITDKLEICMNAIKLINVFEEPMFGRLRETSGNKLSIYDSTNRYLGTSIILLDSEPHEFSYINQFYNLKVLVINNWNLFNYGVFCPNNRSSKADNFKMMCDRYGEMNNKTLETFIIHSSYELNIHVTTRREPLMLEYLCMQLKNFPSLKIVKLYYLDLPLNIQDILINNLENMTHTIKELHIISNTELQSSELKTYCNKHNIIFNIPKLNEFISSNDKSEEKSFIGAFYCEVIHTLKQKRTDEDGGYMRRNKIIDRT